jgi:hypothetical protein
MWRNIGLWVLAAVITVASAVYQRTTGPTYPVSGKVDVRGTEISYELLRSHGGPGDQPVVLTVPDPTVGGTLVWRRYKTDDPWERQDLERIGDDLTGRLPNQPPAGKIEYHVELIGNGGTIMIPPDENVVTRFKGEVPSAVLGPHVLLMFLGMLASTRAGLEALARGRRTGLYAVLAAALIAAGGMVLGPIIQKYAFGAYWTGFPLGMDLTDNKTLISMAVWVIALIAVWKKAGSRWWVVAASAVTLVIFMIPHSLHGSELQYTALLSPDGGGLAVLQPSRGSECYRELLIDQACVTSCAGGYNSLDLRGCHA